LRHFRCDSTAIPPHMPSKANITCYWTSSLFAPQLGIYHASSTGRFASLLAFFTKYCACRLTTSSSNLLGLRVPFASANTRSIREAAPCQRRCDTNASLACSETGSMLACSAAFAGATFAAQARCAQRAMPHLQESQCSGAHQQRCLPPTGRRRVPPRCPSAGPAPYSPWE
jgi:hypothetical protein